MFSAVNGTVHKVVYCPVSNGCQHGRPFVMDGVSSSLSFSLSLSLSHSKAMMMIIFVVFGRAAWWTIVVAVSSGELGMVL